MQNAGLPALGLNWCYLAFEVHPDRLREAIAGAAAKVILLGTGGAGRTEALKLASENVSDLHQGAKALELWTGRAAPIDVMREALRRNVYG